METLDGFTPRRSRCRHGLTATSILALIVVSCPFAAAQRTPAVPPGRAVTAAASPRVQIHDFQFTPATVTVPVGTTVTWTNRDDTLHTVTEANRRFASPGLDLGGEFSYTFANAGSYTYFCSLHPHMTATVIVK
jgi:plastocyanin